MAEVSQISLSMNVLNLMSDKGERDISLYFASDLCLPIMLPEAEFCQQNWMAVVNCMQQGCKGFKSPCTLQ